MRLRRLALLGLPRKANAECQEQDESSPLLSHSPDRNAAPSSLSTLQTTRVSSKFPGYGKSLKKRSKPLIVVPNYRSAGASAKMLRQMYQHPSQSGYNLRNSIDSNLSLCEEEANEELSLRSILAQEDMRGEAAGNRFSRGLKNLRYLPQNMLTKRVNQLKARFSDSLDEESDLDSTFSSTWSISSESVKSSISDLYSLGRNKKSAGKRSQSDGIAALLIRSVHAGLALDSVMEDHETPTPSPIKFTSEESENELGSKDQGGGGRSKEEKSGNIDSEERGESSVGCDESLKKFTKRLLSDQDPKPSVSSGESDTETSEDDPSESSTNYNILDDSLTRIEPGASSAGEGEVRGEFEAGRESREKMKHADNYFDYDKGTFAPAPIGQKKNASASSEGMSSSAESRGSDIWFEKRNSIEETDLIPQNDSASVQSYGERPASATGNESNSSREEILGNVRSYAGASDSKTIAITSSMTARQTDFLERQEHFDDPEDSKPAAASTPTEDEGCDVFFPDVDPWAEVRPANLKRSVSLNDRAIGRFVTPGKISLKKKSESFKTETKGKMRIFKNFNISPGARHSAEPELRSGRRIPDKTEPQPEKLGKKVERNETVIHRAPPPKPVAIVIDSTERDNHCHLAVPVLKVTDVNTKSNFSEEESAQMERERGLPQRTEISMEDLARVQNKLRNKQKRQCMLDLIKIIDTKMLVHSMRDRHRNDSSRSRRHRPRDKVATSLSPSPDSVRKSRSRRKTSRSRSPEESSLQSSATGSSLARPNHSSASSPGSRHAVCTSPSAVLDEAVPGGDRGVAELSEVREDMVKLFGNATPRSDLSDFNGSELKELNKIEVESSTNASSSLTKNKLTVVSVVRKTHSDINLREVQEGVGKTNNTNTANTTDNSCVPCYPDPRRQQPEAVPPTSSPALPTTPTPAGLANNKISKSPAIKANSAVPIHRRSSDSDLSITPKGRYHLKTILNTLIGMTLVRSVAYRSDFYQLLYRREYH